MTEGKKMVKNEKFFPKRLARIRKEKGLTQQALADAVKIHITQLARYEGGTSQPTLDVIRKLAIVLKVSADELLFDETERQPSDDLKLQFEAVSRFPDEEKKIIKALLEGMILKHEAKRWASV
jgi:transcriptional regulator with XRE-family HTH domain